MIREENLAKDYMRLSPIFVFKNDTLFNALEIMKNYGIENISIIREDYSIVGCIAKDEILKILSTKFNNNINILKSTRIMDQDLKFEYPIVLYPTMSIFDAYTLMKCFENKYLPIVDVPWEKKIIGFLWLDDILPIVEETYLKVPV
jgi:predicted transcriptional regulator